jgi:hypothetical protein
MFSIKRDPSHSAVNYEMFENNVKTVNKPRINNISSIITQINNTKDFSTNETPLLKLKTSKLRKKSRDQIVSLI